MPGGEQRIVNQQVPLLRSTLKSFCERCVPALGTSSHQVRARSGKASGLANGRPVHLDHLGLRHIGNVLVREFEADRRGAAQPESGQCPEARSGLLT